MMGVGGRLPAELALGTEHTACPLPALLPARSHLSGFPCPPSPHRLLGPTSLRRPGAVAEIVGRRR